MGPAVRKEIPRLPLDGRLDITYRCNYSCRHCWLRLAPNSPRLRDELAFDEIVRIVEEARRMGCQSWAISGGEPMLRPDFAEVFDYITRRSLSYRLNTNGSLVTPEIARLLTRRGKKMVALYGATAEIHDQVTRTPGSFEAAMRGFAYLREAGAGFIVQIIPMRLNYHQFDEMMRLAQTLSPTVRVGAAWLYLSAERSAGRNRQIASQRLEPAEVLTIDPPNPVAGVLGNACSGLEEQETYPCGAASGDERLFAACIAARRDFHIDPYGQMGFCCFIKEPALRFDLRRGSFHQGWEEFIPSLEGVVRGGQEYQENCGSCDLRRDCRWCGVYGYLEHGRYSAKVEYLCRVARETRAFKGDWRLTHLRYYQIAGITIQISADFPITDHTFAPKFEEFRVKGPGEDNISVRLYSCVPSRSELRLGKQVYRRPPWTIYRQGNSWVYLGSLTDADGSEPGSVAIFNEDHSQGSIYRDLNVYERGGLQALTLLPTDQILLARVLAERQGCYLHASGIVLDGKGFLFVGHSEAGKSTMLKMLREHGEILCDDRVIVRRWLEGFRIHGTWSHGELPDISPASAPLAAILYLEKAQANRAILMSDRKECISQVLAHVVKPLATADWWEKTMDLAEEIADHVPTYRLQFDKSGKVIDVLKGLP
ncbi:MAG: hypothetical protein A2Z16_06060 [Chloroflexi bacterium RBG_16_54_18]|nr:MAG: hypothetical protein A2Z16_06060 [Chloroflexi bacterium RBG_16_54_18]